MFILTEYHTKEHGATVRRAACYSYYKRCADPDSYSGATLEQGRTVTTHSGTEAPYTVFTDADQTPNHNPFDWVDAQVDALTTARIVVQSLGIGGGIPARRGPQSYLVVQGAGNRTKPTAPLYSNAFALQNVVDAIAANRVLYVAGWGRDANGNYIMHSQSMGCKGGDDGCIWAPFTIDGAGSGTSVSAPHVGAALASVLAVFPDTSPVNLAKFAKACARRSGQGIGILLATHGGVGVADFTCMGTVTGALANLPVNGTANVAVGGKGVTVGGRQISLSFASALAFSPNGDAALHGVALPGAMKGTRLFVNAVPTGRNHLMLTAGLQKDDFFASAGFGTEEGFFGFTEGHGEIRGARLTAGHENFFFHVARTDSADGEFIREATGRSMGATLWEKFRLTEHSALEVQVQTDRFLGGSAAIGADGAHFGQIRLREGGWNHRLGLSSTTAIGDDETVRLTAGAYLPDHGKSEVSVGVRYQLAF